MNKRIFHKSLFFFGLTLFLFIGAYCLGDIHYMEAGSTSQGIMTSSSIESINIVHLVTSVLELINYTL